MSAPFHAAMPLSAALAAGEKALAEAHIGDARREARLALQAATGLSLTRLIADESHPLGEAAQRLAEVIARRARHEPLSRITGSRAFFGLDLALSPATLDPRPETEHIVEAAIAGLRDHPAPRVLDLGTGSGAILIALAHALPRLTGLGIDIAAEAVETASTNAGRHGLNSRLNFRQGDLTAGLTGPFDAILSNPPYIPSNEIPNLMPEVRLHDPLLALDGGPDGLDFYRRIITDVPRLLARLGFLALEIGAGQASDVTALLHTGGFSAPETIYDYAGHARILVVRFPTPQRHDAEDAASACASSSHRL